jgi:hypothetical protein
MIAAGTWGKKVFEAPRGGREPGDDRAGGEERS